MELRAWQILCERYSGKTLEELSREVEEILTSEPEALNP